MPRPLPAHPRTRAEEIMRARGVTQSELINRTGWSQGQLNRVVVGRTRLSPARAATLARLLDCPVGALYGGIGEPIPPSAAPSEAVGGVADRLAALLAVLGCDDIEAVALYLFGGDYTRLPLDLASQLRQALRRPTQDDAS